MSLVAEVAVDVVIKLMEEFVMEIVVGCFGAGSVGVDFKFAFW